MSARIEASLEALARPRPPIHANGKRRLPFKQIDCVDLRRLAGLPPVALKVWLYHHGRSGESDTSYPSLETIASDTGQNLQTVKRARKWLRSNGWLIDEGGHRTGGRASVRVIRCLIPSESPRPRVVFPPSVASRPRMDFSTSKNPPTEVDSKPLEVHPPLLPAERGGQQNALIQHGNDLIEVVLHDRHEARDFRRAWTRDRANAYVGAQTYEVANRLRGLGFEAFVREGAHQ
jgi:hypothetical protein